jgi:hypothetical protein
MKPTWVIPAILVAGLAGLGGLTQAASAQDDQGRDAGYVRGERGDDSWSGQRWRDDDRRGNDDRGPRWRDRDDDRRGYGSREGRRGDDDCGPRGRGFGHHGRGHGMHHGYSRDRDDDRREGRGDDGDRGSDRREGRGDGWREGRRYDRDDRGYRGHGHHHRYHHRQDGRQEGREGRQDDRRGGPRRFGLGVDPARLESAKKEIGVTEAQEQVWTKYASTLKEVADARKARRDSIDRSAIRRMSAEEHRKFRDAMIEQRRKEQDSVNAAVDELVKSLDEKQVAIAREVLPGYAFGYGMRAGMGSGMGPGMRSGGGGNR